MRRGWCPDMLRPMPTADGLLVRIHPRCSVLTDSQARTIAEGARLFGNGLLDLSSRGNIQIRGVTPDSHPPLVDRLVAAGLLDGVRSQSPFRLTTISPLAGIDRRDRIDAAALAQCIEAIARDSRGLHPKLSIVVDGGGAISLDAIGADIRLVALDATRIALGLARLTETRWAGVQTLPDVPATIDLLLRAVAAAGAFAGLRVREIGDDGLAQLLGALRLPPPEAPPDRLQAPHAGCVLTDSHLSVFVIPPYGRCTFEGLGRVADWSEEYGSGEIRLSPFRALAIPCVNASGEASLAALARETGFIVDPGDPRLAVSTCAGMQGCGRGSTLTHADSDRLAAALPVGVSLHVSGCRKGCAHPAPADLTLVGDEGSYQVVLGGSARDKPLVRAGLDDIVDKLARVSDGKDLMRVFEAGRP